MSMNKVFANADEAVADIQHGATIMVGGFGLRLLFARHRQRLFRHVHGISRILFGGNGFRDGLSSALRVGRVLVPNDGNVLSSDGLYR